MSRPPADVLRDAEELTGEGVTEVVLLGQNIDRYGKDLPGSPPLASLLRTLDGVRGLRRLRFVTSHPRDVTDELLEAVRDCPTVCEYLHAPAQSGASRILSAMGRGYDREGYLRMVERARRTVPGIEIASDFIAGFPGETEEDHAGSVSLIRAAEFQNGYFFKYSPRPGTPAAELPDDVPGDVKRRRHAELLAAQDEVSSRRNAELVGSEVEILVEGVSRRDPDRVTGRSRTWRTCVLPKGYSAEPGAFVRARVTGSTALTLFCEPRSQ
jgi:tRNA-2-methylthio-N6-dimethylallyladenosine synthase